MATSCPEAAVVTWTVLKSNSSDRCWTWASATTASAAALGIAHLHADGRAARAFPARHQRPRGGDGRNIHDRCEGARVELPALVHVHGRARHVQTHAPRALVERRDAELLHVAAKQAVLRGRDRRRRSGEQHVLRPHARRRARRSRTPGSSAGPGRSACPPASAAPPRGRSRRALAAGPAPPPPRPRRSPGRGTAPRDRHSSAGGPRRDRPRSRPPASRPWSTARRSRRRSRHLPRSGARGDGAARARRDQAPRRRW